MAKYFIANISCWIKGTLVSMLENFLCRKSFATLTTGGENLLHVDNSNHLTSFFLGWTNFVQLAILISRNGPCSPGKPSTRVSLLKVVTSVEMFFAPSSHPLPRMRSGNNGPANYQLSTISNCRWIELKYKYQRKTTFCIGCFIGTENDIWL